MCAISVRPCIKKPEIPETTLGLHVGPTLISWALIDCNLKVLHWDWKQYNLNCRDKMYNLISVVTSVVAKIPNSSVYVIEDFQFMKTKHQKILSIQEQLSTSIMACLTLRDGKYNTKNIYVFRPQTTGRIFKLMIGGESICSKYIVNITATDSVIKFNNTKSININIDSDTKEMYIQMNNADQEQMRLSLLKAMSFIILVIYRNNLNIPS
ncbi:transcription elongation factor, mitochondrial-like isoform X2 [Colletes gigas]|nr:transcription elongation factor, mitochondrial-like isoform X2 [Colletes gigas]